MPAQGGWKPFCPDLSKLVRAMFKAYANVCEETRSEVKKDIASTMAPMCRLLDEMAVTSTNAAEMGVQGVSLVCKGHHLCTDAENAQSVAILKERDRELKFLVVFPETEGALLTVTLKGPDEESSAALPALDEDGVLRLLMPLIRVASKEVNYRANSGFLKGDDDLITFTAELQSAQAAHRLGRNLSNYRLDARSLDSISVIHWELDVTRTEAVATSHQSQKNEGR